MYKIFYLFLFWNQYRIVGRIVTKENEMSLFGSISPLIQICRYTGLAPFSIDQTNLVSSTALKRLSNIFAIVIILLICIVVVFNKNLIDHTKIALQVGFLNVFMFLNHLHALVTLFEFRIKREQHIDLLHRFDKLDILMKRNFNMSIDHENLRNVCWRFIFVWICEISAFVISVLLLNTSIYDQYTIFYALVFLPSCIISRLSYVYSMMLVTLIHENINVLTKYLRSVTKPNGYYMCETSRLDTHQNSKYARQHEANIDVNTISLIKDSYCQMWEAAQKIQNLVYFSLPIGFSDDLFVLIFHSYWFFLCALFGFSDIVFYLFPLINMSSNIGNVFFFAYNCSRAVESVSRK